MSGRKVFVSASIATDSRLCQLAQSNRAMDALLWPHFLPHFDDWGRIEICPDSLKWQVFPAYGLVTADLISEAFEAYADVGLVEIYECDGRSYAAIPPERWFRWQTMIRATKRTDDTGSRLPAPPSWVPSPNGRKE